MLADIYKPRLYIMIQKIVSGAQTGADRAALDAALERGFPCGGWVPKGRIAEDGVVPERYLHLEQTPGADYEQRTEWNVRDSDATLIVSHGPLNGGSLYTLEMAEKHEKPCLHVDLTGLHMHEVLEKITPWLHSVRPAILNIAGPRTSKDARIYDKTLQLTHALIDLSAHEP